MSPSIVTNGMCKLFFKAFFLFFFCNLNFKACCRISRTFFPVHVVAVFAVSLWRKTLNQKSQTFRTQIQFVCILIVVCRRSPKRKIANNSSPVVAANAAHTTLTLLSHTRKIWVYFLWPYPTHFQCC